MATAEVVVIGGGVNGTSTAFQLTALGVRGVHLLERRHLAAGATGKSGALVRMHYTNEHESRLAVESLKVFRDFAQVVGGTAASSERGFCRSWRGATSVPSPPTSPGNSVSASIPARSPPEEIRTILPGAYADDIGAAAYEPDSGFADPSATAFAFAEAARRNGARLETGVDVTGIVTAASRRRRGRDLPGPDRHPGRRARARSLGRATPRTPRPRFRPDAVPHPDLASSGGRRASRGGTAR